MWRHSRDPDTRNIFMFPCQNHCRLLFSCGGKGKIHIFFVNI